MQLRVILRIAENSLLSQPAMSRICGDNRQILLRKCFSSLVNAIETCQFKVHLTILDDHSGPRLIEFLNQATKNISVNLIHLLERGPNYSALKQFQLARDSSELVYVVEDDYLHEPGALNHMLVAYQHLQKRYKEHVVIHPNDCALRYKDGEEKLTRLYYDGMRYWRDVDKTTNTMLTHSSVFKQYWSVYENLAKNYPRVHEDDTINMLYNSIENRSGPLRAFNAIPSVAYHIGYGTPTSINTMHVNWQQLWNSIPDWELIQGWFYHPEFFKEMVNSLPENSVVVEIGAWRGKSTACFAQFVQQSKKNITFYSIDTWQGSDETVHKEIISNLHYDLYQDFLDNLEMCGVKNLVIPIKSTSNSASNQFDPQSVDFVMIDGAHDYESVKDDIECWLPKVKSGGIIAGDDYGDGWPGVRQAVHEIFGNKVSVRGSLWMVRL